MILHHGRPASERAKTKLPRSFGWAEVQSTFLPADHPARPEPHLHSFFPFSLVADSWGRATGGIQVSTRPTASRLFKRQQSNDQSRFSRWKSCVLLNDHDQREHQIIFPW